ncbi:class I SAM-dependent methyltransferase [Novosphingobium soli]|uniref:Methyltransferase domain-containing protein n=1 Tax=Novosphingobium soli TaxID=574956 RepID=A0ABV6CRT6_9SPHN
METAREDGSYFDEAYFERGWERGTAYVGYRESAASNAIFRELGRGIKEIFQPRRTLEIGCATGAIVRELNGMAVDAFGIDVSSWAVANALDPKVSLASAAALPFADNTFDVVYSSHALEHLPDEIYAKAFAEIDRVCGPRAVQFHMLPIIGTYPYDYDPDAARRDLRKDPTHSLLMPMDWWIRQWEDLGWRQVAASVLLPADTSNVELSSGQFCLVRQEADNFHQVLAAINEWNSRVYRQTYLDLQERLSPAEIASVRISTEENALPRGIGPCDCHWDDIKREFESPVNFAAAELHGIVSLRAPEQRQMRIALISESGDVLEKWLSLEPGTTVVRIPVDEFRLLSGGRNLGAIRSVYFGGYVEDFTLSGNFAVVSSTGTIPDIFGASEPGRG